MNYASTIKSHMVFHPINAMPQSKISKVGVFAINSTSSFEYFLIEILIYNDLIYNLYYEWPSTYAAFMLKALFY